MGLELVMVGGQGRFLVSMKEKHVRAEEPRRPGGDGKHPGRFRYQFHGIFSRPMSIRFWHILGTGAVESVIYGHQ